MMKKVLLVMVLAFAAAGCKSVYYHQRLPVLERPDRPKLVSVPASEMGKLSPQARKDVTDNFNRLIDHARKLEEAVDAYNEYAKKKNEAFNKGERR
jgi:hypothetical protein